MIQTSVGDSIWCPSAESRWGIARLFTLHPGMHPSGIILDAIKKFLSWYFFFIMPFTRVFSSEAMNWWATEVFMIVLLKVKY